MVQIVFSAQVKSSLEELFSLQIVLVAVVAPVAVTACSYCLHYQSVDFKLLIRVKAPEQAPAPSLLGATFVVH
jgi:hypothetical protein